jgi:rare lipoprotein A (peptidoglycan hydrolase)
MLQKYYFNILLACITSIILSSCSSSHGPSVQGVCKSCKPYYVRDEWHYPQKHYGYDEVGLASWYGPGFHGKPKPHGELYNQFEMTAAHKTLPIPTIVLVENLQTGAKTKVLIDDRGPFVYEGRIIDLSVAAAKEIGVYKKGTAKVRVTALAAESDRFARHLAQYKRAKCPKGRRWVKIFQDDIAGHHSDLRSSVYHTESHTPLREPQKKIFQSTVYKQPSLEGALNDAHSIPIRVQKPQGKIPQAQKVQVVTVHKIHEDPLDYVDPDNTIKTVSKPVFHEKGIKKIAGHKPVKKDVVKKKSSVKKQSRAIVKKIHCKKR